MFTAVVPPAEVVGALDAFVEPRRASEPQLRWTRPGGWHVTTSFMGDVADRCREPLQALLADVAARTAPIRIGLQGGGAFPSPREARAVWVGVTEGADELAVLARRVRTAGTRAGVRVEGGRFVPHLTLGRASRALNADRLVRVIDAWVGAFWMADELCLIESHLRDRANRYEVIDRQPLAGTPGSGARMPG